MVNVPRASSLLARESALTMHTIPNGIVERDPACFMGRACRSLTYTVHAEGGVRRPASSALRG